MIIKHICTVQNFLYLYSNLQPIFLEPSNRIRTMFSKYLFDYSFSELYGASLLTNPFLTNTTNLTHSAHYLNFFNLKNKSHRQFNLHFAKINPLQHLLASSRLSIAKQTLLVVQPASDNNHSMVCLGPASSIKPHWSSPMGQTSHFHKSTILGEVFTKFCFREQWKYATLYGI